MRKIRIMEHISLDGVLDGEFRLEDGEGFTQGGWTMPFRSPAGLEAVMEAQGGKFDLLLGRRTYDAWADFWPEAGNTPIANGINAATKYVATHRPGNLKWGPVADLGADIIEGIRGVKSTDGPDLIVWGSSTLTSVLLDQGSSTRSYWAGVNASFRAAPTRANWLLSARRRRPQACS